ncbi:MAG: CarD family transcriptional regulator [Eubacteriales bacterium]|nr:CarD family transcriptional regulator [Eubacteriales bacterium]
MFIKGDCIVYGANGVCKVTDVCESPFGGGDMRIYYALKPLDDNGSVIYTPAEGGRIALRALTSREDIEKLLNRINDIPDIVVNNEKQRKESYKEAMAKASPEEYIRIIKTVASRRENAVETHRHLAITDTEYERQAKYCLYNELALVLDMPFGEIESYIKKKTDKKSGQ